jgi:hypothetical protein
LYQQKGEGLGLGLLDWNSHCAAISVSWLLKYRDTTDAPWKNVLDLWLSSTILDKGAAFSSLSVRELTAHLDPKKAKRGAKSNLSYFWKSALTALKDNLRLTPIENRITPPAKGWKDTPSGITPVSTCHPS